MANNYMDVVNGAQIIGTIFSDVTVKPLRPKYIFDDLCREKQWNLTSMPKRGDTMQFAVLSALSANTAALDPTTATISGSQKNTYTRRTVTIDAYGDHMTMDMFEFEPVAFVDAVADSAFNMADQAMNSLNLLARTAMDLNRYSNEVSGTLSSTYHYYASDGTASSMGPLKSIDIRKVVADLKGDNVEPFEDGYFRAVVNPIQAQQIRAESGNAAWRAPAIYKDSVPYVYTGEVGEFEGVRFIVNSNVSGHGTGTISAYILGRDAVGKALGKDVSVSTHDRMYGPQENLMVINWNALVGYRTIRRESLRIIESNNSRL